MKGWQRRRGDEECIETESWKSRGRDLRKRMSRGDRRGFKKKKKPNLWRRALITNEGQMTAGHYGVAPQPSYNWGGEKRGSDVNTQNQALFSSLWPLTWEINNKILFKAMCEKQSVTDLQRGTKFSLLHQRLRCHASSWIRTKMSVFWGFVFCLLLSETFVLVCGLCPTPKMQEICLWAGQLQHKGSQQITLTVVS